MGDADITETPRGMALHTAASLRAPQPESSTPFISMPLLSAPQPKDDQSILDVPLSAPQPFSNSLEADDGETERQHVKTRKNSRRGRRRIQRDHQPSVASRNSICSKGSKSSRASSKTMEPENDAGAQPLHNIHRKPSFTASTAEASGTPYATVSRVRDIDATSSTLDNSFNSLGSNNVTRYNNSNNSFNNSFNNSNSNSNIANLEAARLSSKLKRFSPVSRTTKMTFAGDITTISRARSRSSPNRDDDRRRMSPPPRISAAASSNEDRISSTSFSVPDFTGSREDSVVAEVVDEAQLEAEFNKRMKSRMVEAVEVQLSRSSDVESSSPSKRRSNNSSGGSKDSAKRRNPSAEIIRLTKQRQMLRCVFGWISVILVLAILLTAMVMMLLKDKRNKVETGVDEINEFDFEEWLSQNATEYDGLTYADVFLVDNDD